MRGTILRTLLRIEYLILRMVLPTMEDVNPEYSKIREHEREDDHELPC